MRIFLFENSVDFCRRILCNRIGHSLDVRFASRRLLSSRSALVLVAACLFEPRDCTTHHTTVDAKEIRNFNESLSLLMQPDEDLPS
jgi:hypothetical protein